MNQIFTETNEQLNMVDNSNDTPFSLLKSGHDIANSEVETQNSDKLERERDGDLD